MYVPIGLVECPRVSRSQGVDGNGRRRPLEARRQLWNEQTAICRQLARGLADQYPEVNKGTGVTLVPLKSDLVGPVRPLLLLLVTAVLFVLLIAGVNVANLLLARSSRRATEVAIRTALGASRSRIVWQFLTESVLLALAGGVLGSLARLLGNRGSAHRHCRRSCCLEPSEIRVDERVLLFTIIASVVAGVLFGLVPALKASRLDQHASAERTRTAFEWCPPSHPGRVRGR